jgi:hypothetical protein
VALLNPPELRVSVLLLISGYLASKRGSRDRYERVLDAVAPPSLAMARTDAESLQRDVRRNVRAGLTLGLFVDDGPHLSLDPGAVAAVKGGTEAFVAHLRRLILDPAVNEAAWGRQVGARDLTSALAWFLMYAPSEAPQRMEGAEPSALTMQERDFGPRIGDDETNWPIGANARWQTFEGWVCALGFAWRGPNGALVPDPTPAVRAAMPAILGYGEVLPATAFVDAVAAEVPVLDRGAYREFVRSHMKEPMPDEVLTAPLSQAIARLRIEQRIDLEDRADAPRLNLFDGSTFSHVRGVGR